MNRLQALPNAKPMFLTLNAHRPVREESILYTTDYTHPIFNARAMNAQSQSLVASGPTEHMVLRRLFRGWFS